MIESKVRELVGDVLSADDSSAFNERLDRISELDHAVAMLQAAMCLEMSAFAAVRRRQDLAAGSREDVAGRGARFEIAMARRVSKASIDYQLAFAEPLVSDHPRLLEACLDGKVSQAAAKHIVKEAEVLDPDLRRAIDPACVRADAGQDEEGGRPARRLGRSGVRRQAGQARTSAQAGAGDHARRRDRHVDRRAAGRAGGGVLGGVGPRGQVPARPRRRAFDPG